VTRTSRPSALLLAALLGTGGALTALTVPAAAVPSPDVVVSEVYGGGGNSGATYRRDFIELYNRGSAPVDLSTWSVQYASSSGTSWQVTRLSGSIAPGGHVLVAEAAGSGGTTDLPAPDVTGSISMSATSGKVALVTAGTALSCGADCDTAAGVRDFVGYGSANDAETAPTPALSNTTAALRSGGGATDTDNNAADFTVGAPTPRSSGGAPPPPPPAEAVSIAEVQGAAHVSPLLGDRVVVPGVVTAVRSNGFWVQDPTPDRDPATSEGLFVFTGSRPTVERGQAVEVSGTVGEFRPGGATSANLSTTQLAGATVAVTAAQADLPAPVLVGPGGRRPPPAVRRDAPGDVEAARAFDPARNALDFYEALEGMLVQVRDSVAVGPTEFGEIPVLPGGAGGPRTVRGGVRYTYGDPNTERVFLDDVLAPMPLVDVGARLPGPVDGVLDYSFGNYKLEVLATPAVVPSTLPREVTETPRRRELAVGTFNVENLSPRDDAAKFGRLARTIVTNLASPDLLALEEIQDDNGPTNDSVVTAGQTYARLIEAVVAAGGPRYEFRQLDPTDDADGGQPGGNIRVGFLFRTDRGLSFVDRPGGDATTPTAVARQGCRAVLTLSPGRIAPDDPAFEDSRKPLAGEFRWRGRTLLVIANHFASKGGDQPLLGRYQPPARPSEEQRHAQARAVRAFVDSILAVDRDAAVIVLGDVNDFEFSTTVDILTAGGALVDLPRTLPPAERYTYVFQGNSQVLDHILLSPGLADPRCRRCPAPYEYDIVHVNAEYADQVSDHDPQVVRLRVRGR